MELGLSLGGDPSPKSPFSGFMSKSRVEQANHRTTITYASTSNGVPLDFCMSLGIKSGHNGSQDSSEKSSKELDDDTSEERREDQGKGPVQLDLLPPVPVPRHNPAQPLPWSSDNGSSDGCSSGNVGLLPAARGFDVNRRPTMGGEGEGVSSPNSVASEMRFGMDFGSICRRGGNVGLGNKRDSAEAGTAGNDPVDGDDDENGLARKKLRLSKEQSAYLEESFKEHHTLNPKQKLALAKQLNLRPRQVEVWFQNRRARTKLKQTEVDCEYLKRCCETLTEENRRLHKELQELRALKNTSNHPFYRQLPATTLTMCPSCERVATTSTTNAAAAKLSTTDPSSGTAAPFPLSRPPPTSRPHPFSNHQHAPPPAHPNQPAPS